MARQNQGRLAGRRPLRALEAAGRRAHRAHKAKDYHGGDRLAAYRHAGQRQAALHSQRVRLSASDRGRVIAHA
eukprot:1597211-Prymnesium_polylepis.1